VKYEVKTGLQEDEPKKVKKSRKIFNRQDNCLKKAA
jgi:hypothetical protein